MNKIVPFRKAPKPKRVGWFPVALVTLPLAAFTAVLLLPFGGGGREAEGAVLFASPPDRERAQFALCSGPVRVT